MKLKKCLLLRKKAITNLDNRLKAEPSLCSQKCLVKTMAFPAVMHGCELDHKEGWVLENWWFWNVELEKTLESPLDSKENKPVNPKGNQSWLFTGRTVLKFQYFGHMMQRASSMEKPLMLGKMEGRKRRGWQRMKWLDGFIDSMDMSLSKLQNIAKDGEAWQVAVHGITESQTWLSEWAATKDHSR